MTEKPLALKNLLARTLSPSKCSHEKQSKRRKVSKADLKTRQRKREEIKQQRANVSQEAQNDEVRKQSVERLNQLRNLTADQQSEIERLQNSIVADIVNSVTLAKQQLHETEENEESDNSGEDLPPSWRGLTPGLAPVGYEPDSSDDEPY